MNKEIKLIAERIKSLREIMNFTVEEMALALNIATEEYESHENAECDFSFTFLYNCSRKLGIDITELITGEDPKLSSYSVTRAGSGLPINRRHGFKYLHLAPLFKNRMAEPFIVTAPYSEALQKIEIHLNSHEGQEMDYVLSGSLKCNINGKIEVLNAGDTIFYDSSIPHGMISTNGETCEFVAIVLKKI